MPEKTKSSKTFKPIVNSYVIVYLVLFTVLIMGYLISADEITPFSFIGVLFISATLIYLVSSTKVTITEEVLTQQTFGSKEEIVFFKHIHTVREQNGVALLSDQKTVWLRRWFDDYAQLYELLRKRISPSAFDDHLNFPWKLRMPSQGYGNGIREILLTEEAIIVRQDKQERIWPINQIERIYLTGGAQYRGVENEFDAVIKTKKGGLTLISERQAYSFKFTPERLVANLHRLYPQTASIVKDVPPSTNKLIQQGDAHFDSGNFGKAIKLYEQILNSDQLQWKVWQRLGSCHMQLGNYAEAAAAFRQAFTLNAEDAFSFFNGAIAYSHVGDLIKTRVYLREALALQPVLKAEIGKFPILQGVLV